MVIENNIVVEVEMKPTGGGGIGFEHGNAMIVVLGKLKNVDFEKRIIHIQVKPKDWVVTVVH